MQFIQVQHRQQTYFATLEEQVAVDNPVRLIDAFIDKLDLQKLGFQKTVHHSEGPTGAMCSLTKSLFFTVMIMGSLGPFNSTGLQPELELTMLNF